MKQLLLTFICIAFFSDGFAAGYKVILQRDDLENRDNRPTVSQIPDVEYEESTLKIKCNTQIQYAVIVIKDYKGKAIYTDSLTISQTVSSVTLPDYVDSDKYTIEIHYSDEKLKGLF